MSITKNRETAWYGALTAISAYTQVFHVGYQTQWGMWIDIVGIPWLIAYFLFGIRGGLMVSIASTIIIGLIDQSGWLGASAKFLATIPMILVPYAVFSLSKTTMKNWYSAGVALALALVVRSIIMVIFNYYFALHIWIPGKTTAELFAMFPAFIIVGLNVLQGIIDVVLAWVLVYRTKIRKFSTHHAHHRS